MHFSNSFLTTVASLPFAFVTSARGSGILHERQAAAPGPTVDLGYAKYFPSHNAKSGIYYYRAIPYALPPTGENRWKPPVAIEGHNNFDGSTFNATQIGVSCIQGTPAWYSNIGGIPAVAEVPQSEDCLILDILVPDKPASGDLSVVVQIHGGGYTYGWAQFFPGDAMVHQANGTVIYVSIQYRLGAYGFLAGDEVSAKGARNVGLMDQRAAVEWVQRNIARFGGDPFKITILGGSGGGGSVAHQLIAYGGEGPAPFRAAIAEYPWMQPLLTDDLANAQYDRLLVAANCSNISCLRGLSEQALHTASNSTYYTAYQEPGYPSGNYYYGPTVDGTFIRDLPSREYEAGHYYKVPAIIDHDSDEGSVFTFGLNNSEAVIQSDMADVFPQATPAFTQRLLYELYPLIQYGGSSVATSETVRRARFFGDAYVTCPTHYMATSMSFYNPRTSAVFKLIWGAGGGTHASSFPFIDNLDINYAGAIPVSLAYVFSNYYISFINHMDPNPGRSEGTPFWPSYNTEITGTVLYINADTSITASPDIDANSQCRFLATNSEITRN